jgi:dienelactone hydrolase
MRVWAGAVGLVVALGVSAPARAGSYPACTANADAQHAQLVGLSKSTAQDVMIPGAGATTYAAELLAPNPLPAADMTAPAAVVMHGIDANPCSVRWLARWLAGRGYFVVSVYRPPTTDPVAHADSAAETERHVAAERAGYAYLRSATFPKATYVDPENISLVGHSLGASAAAVLQSEDLDGIRTIVALDGLRHYGAHDRGLPFSCTGAQRLPITPVVPALGLASEATCPQLAHPHNPELRKTGYKRWRSQHEPTAVVALKGFAHATFTGSGTNTQLKRVVRVIRPWLNHFQGGSSSTPFPGVPHSWLSQKFHSAAFVPDEGIDCGQLLVCGP